MMVDTAKGHELSTVTCSVCNYSSHSFCPFDLLSVPIPMEVQKVHFKCTLVRRTQLESGSISSGDTIPAYISYIVDVPRLVDISKVVAKISTLCGVPVERLRICASEEVPVDTSCASTRQLLPKSRIKLLPLSMVDPAPAAKFASNDNTPTHLILFENTLNPRNRLESMSSDTHGLLAVYGDTRECRIVDTNPLPLAKAMSEKRFLQLQKEFAVGLRVDGLDNRGKWYPGNVVRATAEDFTVHFDNFDSKWDERYKKADLHTKVRPVHFHSTPTMRNLELVAVHRVNCVKTRTRPLFGQSFYINGFNEWTCARFGAHILVQACRFLIPSAAPKCDASASGGAEKSLLEVALSAISDLVDLLVAHDRDYFCRLMATGGVNTSTSSIYKRLQDAVSSLLPKLPFKIRVEMVDPITGLVDASKGSRGFPLFSLKTIGNHFSIRNAIVLEWIPRECGAPEAPMILYREPESCLHDSCASFASFDHTKTVGGVDFSDCMDELCLRKMIPGGWTCPRCDAVREGWQSFKLWRLPDILVFYINRYNTSARWQEKLNTRVDFPVTGLDMSPWCHNDAPNRDSIYDLIGIIDHISTQTPGRYSYTATCKVTPCASTGKEEEEAVYNFSSVDSSRNNDSMWIKFYDEQVTHVSPDEITHETADVCILVYRRRQLTASNVAKYSTIA